MLELRGRVIDEGEGARFVPHKEQNTRLRLTKLRPDEATDKPEQAEVVIHSGTHVTVSGEAMEDGWIWGVNQLQESYLPLPRDGQSHI